MFLHIVAVIHLVIFIINFILASLISLIVKSKLNREYGKLNIEESSVSEKILVYLRFTVYALLPITNVAMCYGMLFKTDEIVSTSINKIIQKSDINR